MTLTIYGFVQSRAYRTLWMAEELNASGTDYEHDGRIFNDGEDREFLLGLNPMGQVPVIDDNGFVLAESMAINVYLSKKYDVLAPLSLEHEALTLQWSFWAVTAVESPALAAVKAHYGIMGSDVDPDEEQRSVAQLQRPFAAVDKHLSNRQYLVEDRFSVADLNVASVFAWVRMADIDLTDFPDLEQMGR